MSEFSFPSHDDFRLSTEVEELRDHLRACAETYLDAHPRRKLASLPLAYFAAGLRTLVDDLEAQQPDGKAGGLLAVTLYQFSQTMIEAAREHGYPDKIETEHRINVEYVDGDEDEEDA